jgi:aspartokinase-like uncharacterized kinase
MRIGAVVKVGGSLLDSLGLPSLLDVLAKLAQAQGMVAVPGGGPFADAVRGACARHGTGESAAHWMAILAMDQHAHLLASALPTARLVTDPEGVASAVTEGRLAILAPFAWLRAADPLPHGWHVTSDSIAAWVAARLGAERLVLLKAMDGVRDAGGEILPEVDRRSPALAGIVDDFFPHALEPGLDGWILSGRHPERVGDLFRDARARGTRIR